MIRSVYFVAQLVIPSPDPESNELQAGPVYVARSPTAARSWAQKIRSEGQTVRIVSYLLEGPTPEELAVTLAALVPVSVPMPISDTGSDTRAVDVHELAIETVGD